MPPRNDMGVGICPEGAGQVDLEGIGTCPPTCWFDSSLSETTFVTLLARPNSFYLFSHWEGNNCLFDQPNANPTTAEVPRGAQGNCKAVFVPWTDWATGYAVLGTGESPYASNVAPSGDVVHAGAAAGGGNLEIFTPPAEKPARATPVIKQVSIADFTPYDAIQLDDGSFLLAGRHTTVFRGGVARLAANDTFTWQLALDDDVSRADELAVVDADNFLVGGYLNSDSMEFVAEVSGDGVVGDVVKFDTTAYMSALQALSGGGFAVVLGSTLVRVDAAGAITWQKRLPGYVADLDETTDGGVVASGYMGSDGWIGRFAADGLLMWQKSYAGVMLAEVIPTATGYLAYGAQSGPLMVLELGADAAIVTARSYQDTGGGAWPEDAGLAPDGRLAMAALSSGVPVAILTEPDLSLDNSCGDASFGASVDPATITVADGTWTIEDGTIVSSSITFTPSATTATATSSAGAAVDLCAN